MMWRVIEVAVWALSFGFQAGWLAMRSRRSWRDVVVERLPLLCADIGGAFPKIGQILGTRHDLLASVLCERLSMLQDELPALPKCEVDRLFRESGLDRFIADLDPQPIASATVAQVHLARRVDDGRMVAIKVRRPNVVEKLQADCRIAQVLSRFVGCLPFSRSIPVERAVSEASIVLIAQGDFEIERQNYERLRGVLLEEPNLRVPEVHSDLCRPSILVLEYLPHLRKLTDPQIQESEARQALVTGVKALYRMIFVAGFVHCDMHPGNILLSEDGRVVLLDAGFMVDMGEQARLDFAEFFLAVACRDGDAAARIILRTATFVPTTIDVDLFIADISAIIAEFNGLSARDFQIARFVARLFAVQRRHGVVGTASFTLPILALLVYEGLVKRRHPELNFQILALPFLMRALAPRYD